MAEEQSEPEGPQEDSEESLVDKLDGDTLKGKDVTLSIYVEGDSFVEYFLVAHYEGVEEGKEPREELVNDLVTMGEPVKSDSKYAGIMESLMPDVSVESKRVTVGALDTLLPRLDTKLDELAKAGINVVGVGNYKSPEEFKKAYSELALKED